MRRFSNKNRKVAWRGALFLSTRTMETWLGDWLQGVAFAWDGMADSQEHDGTRRGPKTPNSHVLGSRSTTPAANYLDIIRRMVRQ